MATGPIIVSFDASSIPAEKIRKQFDLPFSGQHVIALRGNGRDQRMALIAAGRKADPMKIVDAIIAQICYVDGKKIRMEDIDAMDFDDALAIREEVGSTMSPLAKMKAVAASVEETEATENDSQSQS